MRTFRILVPAVVMFGLAGLGPGCSGGGPPSPDQETGKKIATDMKTDRQELKTVRSEARKGTGIQGSMKEQMKNRGRH